MIHSLRSSLSGFKNLEFSPGLNVLLAQKEAGATDKQTRNRAGKTSLVEIIHFLLGANVKPGSLFTQKILEEVGFAMNLDLDGAPVTVERSPKNKSKFQLSGAHEGTLKREDWISLLGEKFFGLHTLGETRAGSPSFRSLLSYFIRRENSGGFVVPEKHSEKQQTGDIQVNLLYLLGLDWQIAADWQRVRERERTLEQLKKAAGNGSFGGIIGKTADLRTQVTLAEARLQEMQANLAAFQILPEYADLDAEANRITSEIRDLANENVVDEANLRDMREALRTEAPPPLDALEGIYAEAGISLPGLSLKRYEEVRAFHESVIRNRKDYLSGEVDATTARIQSRQNRVQILEARRTEILAILDSHGALEQYSKLQTECSRQGGELETLKQRLSVAEQLESEKTELNLERGQLTLRLRRDFSEQRERMKQAVLAYEETSRRLYESAGSMTIDDSHKNGPQFTFPMQGNSSKGIKNMQIFCFDMMLMRLCAQNGRGPGFLVHDSHLFDGVDGRQLISALKVGAETAAELGFQYIVTLNEDDAVKESIPGFDIKDHALPTVLTDAKEDGGLFGCRF